MCATRRSKSQQTPLLLYDGNKIALLLLLVISLIYDLPLVCGLERLLVNLKKYHPNWSPESIVDVGANKGAWSTVSRKFYPNAKLLLLEATPVHDAQLTSVVQQLGNAEHQINILSGKTGDTVDWFEGGDTTGNSMFRENTKFYTNAIPNKRTTITLDDAIQKSHLKTSTTGAPAVAVDMIKLDVQGAELLVLEGATKTLGEATFVQIENSVIEYNRGGACIYEVDEILRSHGFYLYDIEELSRNAWLFKSKGVGQYDSLYVRPTSKRLPTDFANVTYCGMGRQPKSKSTSDNDSKKTKTARDGGDTTTTSTNCDYKGVLDQILVVNQLCNNLNPIVLGIACFVTGILVGRRTAANTGNNRTRKQQRNNNKNWFQQRL